MSAARTPLATVLDPNTVSSVLSSVTELNKRNWGRLVGNIRTFWSSRAGMEAPVGAMAAAGTDGIALAHYVVDAAQRQILLWDALRRRGNQYLDHVAAGSPPVLIFDYELLIDGRKLPRPVNYALVRIVPPANVTVNDLKRPYMIVDPRAGHGSGIGGFKDDSQVGVALRAGHPVYFVIFFPEPEPTQTLADVGTAEALFLRDIINRHPNSPKPCVIGNCQGGWAVMLLAAARPDLTGPVVINGAPLSYWAGENGKNPMRYAGGIMGGSWPARLCSDLGNGRFDGAHLVANFEQLNPANTYWSKYYGLYSKIDTEAPRFLEFERWWGGFYLMNAEEMRSIVDNLFIGNKLSHGEISVDRETNIDLRRIKSPIIVFCSQGDNITPPQQALNWIADIYRETREIKAQGQVIVYLVHESIGHLGIFVSGAVARREHKEIIDTLDAIEHLPPGLYEMVMRNRTKPGKDGLEYEMVLEEREVSDLAAQPAARGDEAKFESVRTISEFNSMAYDMFVGPLVRAVITEPVAEALRQAHPMRASRAGFSDRNPALWALPLWADRVRKNRKPVEPGNPWLEMERQMSEGIVQAFDTYRDIRDASVEAAFHSIYGVLNVLGIPALKAAPPLPTANDAPGSTLQELMGAMAAGGELDATVRMLMLVARARGYLSRDALAHLPALIAEQSSFAGIDREALRRIVHQQALLVAEDSEHAMATLRVLLPSAAERRRALKIVADAYAESDEATVKTALEKLRAALPVRSGMVHAAE
jgi:pimeloyl-ACP methyl ester carboxylesterase